MPLQEVYKETLVRLLQLEVMLDIPDKVKVRLPSVRMQVHMDNRILQ
jgi:hypothetical protein